MEFFTCILHLLALFLYIVHTTKSPNLINCNERWFNERQIRIHVERKRF